MEQKERRFLEGYGCSVYVTHIYNGLEKYYEYK